ncbi:helix-turn-helix transcriptional regulator [Streptacidiphilus sp. P02-A3a]|uniref:helix-turn-helix transcriptional regulator n=1 Tax=Streptacidiphilus sp. P02-A3a TaxID=2704468 RepID=UPI0015FACC7C|nr:helix-turn-helix transcriptional regulator [Streptacidiphilus sp. P02-A3a]QMU67065.1 helix-turn-helix domain-containing protein [Streptacidiphilus sp. P02-A3a]
MDDREAQRRAALGAFLRSRRERLTPGDVGLVGGPRRRTPGLRREEVASLSGVSVSWYSWLEQGRPIAASGQVLDALAGTLRLTRAERRHVFDLAGESDSGPRPAATGCPAVGDHLRATVAALAPNPACLLDRHWDILAHNDAEAAIYGGLDETPVRRRNMLWLYFGCQSMRTVLRNWEAESWAILAQFRASADRHPGDPRFDEIVEDVSGADPGFAERWERHDVAAFTPALKCFDHPRLGPLTFRQAKLIAAEDPELHLVARYPADPSTRRALGMDA